MCYHTLKSQRSIYLCPLMSQKSIYLCLPSVGIKGSIMKFSCQRMIDGKDLLQKSLQGMTKTRKYMNEDYSDLHFLPYIIQKPYSEDELETLWTVPSLPPADSSRQSSLYLLMSLSCVAADTICR